MLAWEKRLNRAKSAASKRGFLANLTLDDWNQTCADTENRCVYCEKTLAWEEASIDHFYPMALGGGTTIDNCILCCLACNQRKGETRPDIFLLHNPERFARIRLYLAHRQPGQGSCHFWSFPLPKGSQMNREGMQPTSHKLSSGAEVSVYNDDQDTVLQFRQTATGDTPLVIGVQVATRLTPSECLALARMLLSYAAPRVEEKKQAPLLGEDSASN